MLLKRVRKGRRGRVLTLLLLRGELLMNTDIRISISFKGHRKRLKLQQLLGVGSTDYLLDLWINTAMNHPKGILTGMDEYDIAIEAGYTGDAFKFVDALMTCGLLEKHDNGDYYIHDWDEHQRYVMFAPERSERAKKAVEVREKGRTSKKTNEIISNVKVDDLKSEFRLSPSPAPSPSPSPDPSPSPKPKPSPKKVKNKNNNEQLDLFEEFYNIYPRKTEKSAAKKNWIARMNDKEDPNDIIKAAIAFAQICKKEGREEKFTKHPATFISSTNVWKDYVNMVQPSKGSLSPEEKERQQRMVEKYGKRTD